MDTALSCYVQPFEGRGTPWAWDLHGNAVCMQSSAKHQTYANAVKHTAACLSCCVCGHVGSRINRCKGRAQSKVAL